MGNKKDLFLIRGAGDLATGVALRLHKTGFRVLMTEISKPLAVRRAVSFSEAVFEGQMTVEDLTAKLVSTLTEAEAVLSQQKIPVFVDPDFQALKDLREFSLSVGGIIDARMTKQPAQPLPEYFVIGLGPGFAPGVNCEAVVETMRGHTLGRVYWDQPALENTGLPDGNPDRVLRAPVSGIFDGERVIGDQVETGDLIAQVQTASGRPGPIYAPFNGILRGLIRSGMQVQQGLKVGDIDARAERAYCFQVSDKALAIAGGVLEAILARSDARVQLND